MYRSVLIFLVSSASCVLALFEGEVCTDKQGRQGVCTGIVGCEPALQDLRHHKRPPLCGFTRDDTPIACCVREVAATYNTPHSPQSPRPTTTTEYTPTEPDYGEVGPSSDCKPVRNFTAAANDRIAWKKCLQYQEELVYPCGRDPLGYPVRKNNCKHVANKLIVGGVIAGEAEFPHMVMLSYYDIDNFKGECGGSLISDWFILTAAHCTYKARVGEVQYAATGALQQSKVSRSRIYKIAERLQHPKYDPNYHYYDIALLKTETRMKLDMLAVPACLDLGDDNDGEALATGWGALHKGGQIVDHLRKVPLKKFNNRQCIIAIEENRKLPFGFRPDVQSCYGDKLESKDACGGDSGGPLQLKMRRVHCMYSVAGVTSFGRGCGTIGLPGVYTRVAPFVSWIESQVWPNE